MISKVNKQLLPMKGHYFLYNAGTAPVVPFLPVLGRQLGFSGTVIGVIYTVLPVCGMLAKPLMGALADRYQIKKLLFLIFQIVTATALLPINFIPKLPTHSLMRFACDGGAAVLDTSPVDLTSKPEAIIQILEAEKGKNGSLTCQINCPMNKSNNDWRTVHRFWGGLETLPTDDRFVFIAPLSVRRAGNLDGKYVYFPVHEVRVDGVTSRAVCPNQTYSISQVCDVRCDSDVVNRLLEAKRDDSVADVAGYYQFWVFFVLAIMAWVGMAVVVSIGDAICFEMLGDQPSLYGQQRLWGSVGWGLFSIFAGLMVDRFSNDNSNKDYTSVFILMLVIMLLDVLNSSQIKCGEQKMSSSIIKDIGRLLARLRIVVFMVWCILMGMCTAMVWQFLFWHLEDLAAGYPDSGSWIKTLEGLVMGIQCLGGELPFFFLSGWILRKVGHVHCMTFVLLGVGIRFMLYSVLVNPWWVLPIELMNGITFGLFYATMASYASIVAPPGTEATVQGLVGAVFEGVGISLGSLLGGMLMDKYHGATTFRIFSIASFVCCALHFLVQYVMERRSTPKDRDFESRTTTRYAAPADAIRIFEEDRQQLSLVEH